MWGKYDTAKQATDDHIIQRMRLACRITKTTDTHSDYVIRIVFTRQQWLHGRASVTVMLCKLPVLLKTMAVFMKA
jgi:hypothetical protein